MQYLLSRADLLDARERFARAGKLFKMEHKVVKALLAHPNDPSQVMALTLTLTPRPRTLPSPSPVTPHP